MCAGLGVDHLQLFPLPRFSFRGYPDRLETACNSRHRRTAGARSHIGDSRIHRRVACFCCQGGDRDVRANGPVRETAYTITVRKEMRMLQINVRLPASCSDHNLIQGAKRTRCAPSQIYKSGRCRTQDDVTGFGEIPTPKTGTQQRKPRPHVPRLRPSLGHPRRRRELRLLCFAVNAAGPVSVLPEGLFDTDATTWKCSHRKPVEFGVL
ncbi:hypothetical protein N656DRAFT_386010 [Canariomyces notabilis]|uniref:Uncharacterized protein n=1 Tax=Canariomyces notabilis TaxID=2074819 RepID=A0AAN6YVH5_9PEZI|nr:hypothetical protein N656DRAFT_386010 [Canariomyces arenarius]